jgi:predicted nucleic-acid-binding Zn-ribbon protein
MRKEGEVMDICKFCYSHNNMEMNIDLVIDFKDKLPQGVTEVDCLDCGYSYLYEKKLDKVKETVVIE